MNLRIFGFKLLAILLQTLKIMLLFAPIVMSLRAMRAHHFYFMDELQAALFISFGLGMAVAIFNAFEFENFKHIELSQYLKTHQTYTTNLSESVDSKQLLAFIKSKAAENGMTIPSTSTESENVLELEALSPYKFKDKIKVTLTGKQITIESKPKNFFWPVDLGRNYKNILSMLLVIKQMPLSS